MSTAESSPVIAAPKVLAGLATATSNGTPVPAKSAIVANTTAQVKTVPASVPVAKQALAAPQTQIATMLVSTSAPVKPVPVLASVTSVPAKPGAQATTILANTSQSSKPMIPTPAPIGVSSSQSVQGTPIARAPGSSSSGPFVRMPAMSVSATSTPSTLTKQAVLPHSTGSFAPTSSSAFTPSISTLQAASSSSMPITALPGVPSSQPRVVLQSQTTPKRPMKNKLEDDDSEDPRSKRGRFEKGKGLRHFAMRVCQKVKDKGTTTYNEVADELVLEQDGEIEPDSNDAHAPKNIRRRVYDALNVLMAMNIIAKDKKEIRWIGLPTTSQQEFERLEESKKRIQERISKKREHLYDLVLQQIAFKNLIARNEARQLPEGATMQLPFIVVNTDKDTIIECQMTEDKSEYFFDFSAPFEIHDDIEILKRMGLTYGLESGKATLDQLAEAKKLIPSALHGHLDDMYYGTPKASAAPGAGSAPASSAQGQGPSFTHDDEGDDDDDDDDASFADDDDDDE
eukprot:m.490288 g.490288  ORF g.490288 m.490288 type:complete len:513 (+) comp57249_c1_seq1:316-1854(+)